MQTDIVTLIYADPTLALNTWPLDAIAADGSSMTVNAGTSIIDGADGLRVGDLILFSNAQGNAMQTVTRISGGQTVFFDPADPTRTEPAGGSRRDIFGLMSTPGVFPPTTATRISMVSYYVDNVTDPNLPRLVRQVNGGARLAIALGVENLQIHLRPGRRRGESDQCPDMPTAATARIRSARSICSCRRARSIKTREPHQFLRNSMATEVGLRSMSFVDRYK